MSARHPRTPTLATYAVLVCVLAGLLAGCLSRSGAQSTIAPATHAAATPGHSSGTVVTVLGHPGAPPGCRYNRAVLAAHPLGYWPLQSGPPVTSAARGGPAATLGGAGVLTFGAPGAGICVGDHALALGGGLTRTVSFGHSLGFAGRRRFSVEIWVRPTRIDRVYRSVFEHEQFSPRRSGWVLWVQNRGASLELWNDGRIVAGVVVPVKRDSWNYLVFTWDTTAVRGYLDGVLRGAGPGSGAQLGASRFPLYLGGDAHTQPFVGSLEAAAVYPYALPAATVARHWADRTG